MKKTLQQRLFNYLKARPYEKVAKGKLADLARQNGGYTGETVGRRMRVFAEVSEYGMSFNSTPEHHRALELLGGAKIKVEHRGKNHCFYWYEPTTKTIEHVEVVDGRAVISYKEVSV